MNETSEICPFGSQTSVEEFEINWQLGVCICLTGMRQKVILLVLDAQCFVKVRKYSFNWR